MEKLNIPLPLYRGIAIEGNNTGKMVEGNVIVTIDEGTTDISILPYDIDVVEAIEILPETLGIYFGQEDMNGKNVFTGDVLKFEFDDDDNQTQQEHFLLFYDKGTCSYRAHCSICKTPTALEYLDVSEGEIIGNIHENPELLMLFPHLQEVNV